MKVTSTTLRTSTTLTALFMTVALVGCGGGGGSDYTSTVPPSPLAPVPAPPAPVNVISTSGNLQTTATASAYGAGSLGDSFYTSLNTIRAAAGAGMLNENTALDTASQTHSLYVVTNLATEGITHVEQSTSPDYYGTTFTDRDAKAGYAVSGVGTEVIGGGDLTYGLLATAYHGAALLSNSTDVGFGSTSNQYGSYSVADLGAPVSSAYGQIAATGNFVAYPYSGQTSVIGTFYVSDEVPRVSTTVLPNATAGAPVIVNIQNADYVNFGSQGTLAPVVTSFSMTDASSTVVPSVIIANSAITGGTGVTVNSDSELTIGFAELIPTSPLTSGATYTVTFSATLKTAGAPLTKTWSFQAK